MIQFFANNYELVLPDDFSTPIIDENALITRNGEYSLDMTLSLLESNNALAFGFPQRINAKSILKEVDARMIDNLKVITGRFVVISNTNTSITIQFIAGNSELNFLSKQSKKIWELDFGTESDVNYSRALFSIQHPGYGDVVEDGEIIGFNKFVCVPVKFSNLIANDYTIQPAYYQQQDAQIDGVNDIVIQPYLMHYINLLPDLLGFELVENVLMQDELAKELFLSNKIQSLRYSDALPDISISDFVDAIEEFFNVFFYVTKDRKCRIVNQDVFINNKSVIKLTHVVDAFERKNEKTEIDNSCIAYDLSADGYMRYQKLDKDIVKTCTVLNYSYASVMRNSITHDKINKFIIHKTLNNNREHVFTPPSQMNVYRVRVNASSGYCYYVNKFKDSSESDNPIRLKVKPLAFTYIEKNVRLIDDMGVQLDIAVPYQLPMINSNLYSQKDQFILNAIESSLESLPRKDSIEVAVFSGMIDFYGPTVRYPFSYLDNNPEFWLPQFEIDSGYTPTYENIFNQWINDKFKITCSKTLRLTGDDGIYNRYFKNLRYDQDTIFMFIIEDKADLNTTNLFEYNNQIYIPIKFEREFSDNKSRKVTGYFYRMKS